MDFQHVPVLEKETIETLNPLPGKTFIDATVNGGGHAEKIINIIGTKGKFLGIDWDCDLIDKAEKKYPDLSSVFLRCGNYADMKKIAGDCGILKADGVLFDLGYSSYHIEVSGRGFSFLRDEALDMRYSPKENNLTASEIANEWSQEEIEKILKDYGEERFAKKIAKKIVEMRKKKKFETTKDLVEAVIKATPKKRSKIHPATRAFQAFRIAVNKEFENLEKGLEAASGLLSSGGKIAVISFHSGEDRIVKNFFKKEKTAGILKIISKKPLVPSYKEILKNPRSRSAKLRVAEKI